MTKFKELSGRLIREFSKQFGGLKSLFSSGMISHKNFISNINGNYETAAQFIEAFRQRKNPSFFISCQNRNLVVKHIKKEFNDYANETIRRADEICNGILNITGSGKIDLKKFSYIPWHYDFTSAYNWNPKKYYKKVKIPYGKAEIKIPWELSRFHYTITLGQAYYLTGDEKYAKKFTEFVKDWIDSNPYPFGVNWNCTMEVAIRESNWIWGYYFFKESSFFSDDFLLLYLKSILQHSRHIMNNLERSGPVNTNHYLSNLSGLIYAGILFPEFKESGKWRSFAINELFSEIKKQINSDGMDFEGSVCYHCFVTELLLYTIYLLKLNKNNIPQEINGRLEDMFKFILYTIKPDGRVPQIGDNDSGRIHKLKRRSPLDFSYLLTYATIFFDEPIFKMKEFNFAPEALWVFGGRGYDKWKNIKAKSLCDVESNYFKRSGIYVFRHKDNYIIISNCPNGQGGQGGHNHNDKLSFELSVEGDDVIVDPGVYVYTSNPEYRNKFRATKYHNTIEVDGKEQNLLGDNLFRMEGNADTYLKDIKENEEVIDITLSHDGYRRLKGDIVHSRRFIYSKIKKELNIKDKISGKGEHNISLNLHFSKEIEIKETDTKKFAVFHQNLSSPIYIKISNFDDVSLGKGYVSREYGRKDEAVVINGTVKTDLPFESEIIIVFGDKSNIEDLKNFG